MFEWALINGLCLGAIYILATLGLALIYGVFEIPDFAQAGLYCFGAYFVFTMMNYIGLNYFVSLIISVALITLIGIAAAQFLYGPVQRSEPRTLIIVALGMLYILDNSALLIWGHDHRSISIAGLVGKTVTFGEISISYTRVFAIIIAGVLSLIVYYLLMKTKTGDAIRATIQNREGAVLMGIKIGRMRLITFTLSCVLITIAGSLIGSIFSLFPHMGDYIIIKGFGAVILGGVGSIVGAVLGALIIGFIESFGSIYISSAYKDIFTFGLILLIVLIRPYGLLGRKEGMG